MPINIPCDCEFHMELLNATKRHIIHFCVNPTNPNPNPKTSFVTMFHSFPLLLDKQQSHTRRRG